MKTAHRKASHQKHRWQKDYSVFGRIIGLLEPFSPDELMRLELPIRMSFEALKNGKGCESDFHDIAAAINCTLVRSEEVDPMCEYTAISARDALMRTWHRWEKTGKWGFDGPALQEVEAGIDLHEQLIRLSTPGQMVKAMREVIRRGHKNEVVQ